MTSGRPDFLPGKMVTRLSVASPEPPPSVSVLMLAGDSVASLTTTQDSAYRAQYGERAMKEFLQGKWLGHPLHAALVHLPMALWPAAAVFDVLAAMNIGGSGLPIAAHYS